MTDSEKSALRIESARRRFVEALDTPEEAMRKRQLEIEIELARQPIAKGRVA